MWSLSFSKKLFGCLFRPLVLELERRALGRFSPEHAAHSTAKRGGSNKEPCSPRPVQTWVLILMLGALAGCEALSSFKGGTAGPVTQTEQIQLRYQSAVDAITLGEYESARVILEELVESHPGLTTPYVNLGIIADQQGDHERAMGWYQKALEVDASQPEALNQLGILYRQKGQLNKALETYRRALAANDRLPQIHYNLGILYDLYLGDYTQAVHHYERYQELTGAQNARVQQWIQDLKRRSR